ncbi:hypothetical protein YTPLAS21_11300 [Candidatus Nitrosocosmicus sp.]|jgi:hypothetical protein|uniref:hypothetical protein n=1 Tax=Candidatus Nitrosocosmicus sp. FF01 TaxID=3397670 RepID=UPI002ACCB406|nr:hypothetical protein YTPLAS21_11300 [Candidatus Nitrosocosmicus sp.]
MQNYLAVIVALVLTGGFAFVAPVSNVAMALPFDFLERTYIFGPITGISEDDNGSTEWVLAGVWRASLPNSTDISNNNTNGTTFNAAIEMIRPDGSARHTHTLTDFVLLNPSSESGTNSTIFNGTSTVSLADGPALDIPTSVKLSNNNIITIWLDPESSDNHFGISPKIFGVVTSPEFDKSIQDSVSMTNGTQISGLVH